MELELQHSGLTSVHSRTDYSAIQLTSTHPRGRAEQETAKGNFL